MYLPADSHMERFDPRAIQDWFGFIFHDVNS